MSSGLAHVPEHAKVVITLIGGVQGTFFYAHSVADIETLIDKKHVDINIIILWKDSCSKLAVLYSL